MPNKEITRQLDCNGCVACCIGENIHLDAKVQDQYETELDDKGEVILAHKEDGRCFYLGTDGCTIYPRRPAQCKAFSCVWMARTQGIQAMQKLCTDEVIRQAIFRVREINREKNKRRQKMLYKKKPKVGKPIKRKGTKK